MRPCYAFRMAKIYETEKDIQRERAAADLNHVRRTTNFAAETLSFGGSLAIVGFLAKLIPKKAQGFWQDVRKTSNVPIFGGILLSIFGVLLASWAHVRGKKAKEELTKFGPEQIIGPCCAEDYLKPKAGHVARLTQQTATQTHDKAI